MDTVFRALRRLAQDGLVVGVPRRGYRVQAPPDPAARDYPLGLVLSGQETEWDPFEQRLVIALQQEAAKQGRTVLTMGRGNRSPGDVAGELLKARVRGVLLNVSDAELSREFVRAGLPVVLAGAWHEHSEIDLVSQDGLGGAMAAAMYLAGRGHTRIGWLGFRVEGNVPQVAERYCGAVGGLARAGLKLAPERTVEVPKGDREAAFEGGRQLLSGPERPTGILALWQPMVVGLLRAAAGLGLTPGRDFELVGWINEEAYEHEYLPLFAGGQVAPAITWSLRRMAQAALARVEERLAHPALPPLCLKIPARLRFGDDRRPEQAEAGRRFRSEAAAAPSSAVKAASG